MKKRKRDRAPRATRATPRGVITPRGARAGGARRAGAAVGRRDAFGPLARVSGMVARHLGHASRTAAHAALVWTPSSLFGVLTGREFGAELPCPPRDALLKLNEALESGGDASALSTFTEAQRCAFLLQYGNDPRKASTAMRRSVKWRETYAFLPRAQLRAFEDVVFVHGKRNAYTGGVHLVLRLSEVHRIQSELGYDAVVAAIVSHVEQQWAAGRRRRPQGVSCAAVWWRSDCRGVTPGTFRLLVATTLVTLDSNYPELAAEVHVVNVWWLVKRFLTTLLEATSASTRRRVRIYRGDDTGAEKLGIRFRQPRVARVLPRRQVRVPAVPPPGATGRELRKRERARVSRRRRAP